MSPHGLSPRPTTFDSKILEAADRAEQRGVDRAWKYRLDWYALSLELVALANSANSRDIEGMIRHHNHLAAVLVRMLSAQRTEQP